MTTLFTATLELARILGPVRDGTTTSNGTTTTAIDSVIAEPNDYYNNGTIWVAAHTHLTSSEAARARVVSDYNSTTKTLTFEALAVQVDSGVSYSAANEKFPLWMLKQSIRQALREIGPVMCETTFVSTGAETYLAASCAAIDKRILQVWEAKETSAPYNWVLHRRWVANSYGAAGARELNFWEGSRPESGNTIRVIYADDPAEPSADSDEINGQVSLHLLLWTAAVYILNWRLSVTKTDEPETKTRLEQATQNRAMAQMRNKVNLAAVSSIGRW